MSDLDPREWGEIQPTKGGLSGFLQCLSGYYSQFLETDFKATREPKRRYSEKNGQMRVGAQLSGFNNFQDKITDKLGRVSTTPISVRLGQYTASLPLNLRQGIQSAIRSISTGELRSRLNAVQSQCVKLQEKPVDDFEKLIETIEDTIHNIVQVTVIDELINLLRPIVGKKYGPSSALENLENFSDELTEICVESEKSFLAESLSAIIFEKNEQLLSEYIEKLCNEDLIKEKLHLFFDSFIARDAFVEIRELISTQKITENTQLYLNIGEIITKKSRFPIYYIPLDVEIEKEFIRIELSSSIYANKKAVGYVISQMNKNDKIVAINPLSERIFNKLPDETHSDIINGSFNHVLSALQAQGEVDLFAKRQMEADGLGLRISNAMTITVFDKSDESIVNDYEQLMVGLEDDHPLVQSFKSLISSFLTTNPISVEAVIDKEWDSTSTPDRLVFQSPLPLAEEQRKVLSSLRNPDTKFVIVEGPPGTGKSHTITAIAFELILKGQNILILSDKKEALDVVEAKINDVISKVRGNDIDYVNPILRLGKTDSNYSNIIKNSSINKLKTSVQQFNANKKAFQKKYSELENLLKSNVQNKISALEEVDLEEISNFHTQELELFEQYPELDEITEDEEAQIYLISELMEIVDRDRQRFAALSGSEQSVRDHLDLMRPVQAVPGTTKKLLSEFPNLNLGTAQNLSGLADQIDSAKNFLFGYLFSGGTLAAIARKIEQITGRFDAKPQNYVDLYRRLARVPQNLKQALSEYRLDHVALQDFQFAAQMNPVSAETTTLVKEFLDAEFSEEVAKRLPTNIDALLRSDDKTLKMLAQVKQLKRKREELGNKFDSVPKYDFLKDKTQFEQMNTWKLVNTIDERVTTFAAQRKADARTLQQIIRAKAKFPLDKFGVLKEAFPCMIAGLRDYAEFIPFESGLFDLVIIDEASQVSIAQALPAILRAKQVLVLGDRRQFGNVKTSNASKMINTGYFHEVINTFKNSVKENDISQIMRANNFNITKSVMDFFELSNNFTIQLKKHFRGYPEMISFSNKYVYPDGLQALKIRGKPIDEVLEFVQVSDLDRVETIRNVSEQEASLIIDRLNQLASQENPPSVAIITPFRDQVTYLQKRVSDLENQEDLVKKLRLAIFTFDTCQGEERDIVFYSLVANRNSDALNYIFPRELRISEDEIDGSLKFQRLNVGFSRGKEKLVFVHSKPLDEFSGSIKLVLQHYRDVLNAAKALPSETDVDQNSPMEAQVLDWLKSTSFISRNLGKVEIIPQFELGSYLKALDPTYNHPAYKVDFLIRLTADEDVRQCVIEYDGFEYHFDDRQKVDSGNWQSYLTAGDVERESVLESYGYKMLRINRFTVGNDPVATLDERLSDMFQQFEQTDESHELIANINKKIGGLESGDLKSCTKCGLAKPLKAFYDRNLKSGYGRVCSSCKKGSSPKSRRGFRRRRYY